MPQPTIGEMPVEEQVRRPADLRRARYGYFRALHRLLLGAAGRTPSAVASVLFCSRSSVYRSGRAYRAGTLSFGEGSECAAQQSRRRVLTPALKRSVLALLKTAHRAVGLSGVGF